MGYSDSLETVENRRDQLGALMKGEPVEWRCKPGNEKTIAYQVRECMNIGERNPQIYPGLAKAAKEFSVVVNGPGSVVTRPKRYVTAEPVSLIQETLTVVKAKEEEKKELAFEGPQIVTHIVQRWLDNPGTATIHFPDAALTIEDLKKLHKWAKEQRVLVFFKDPMITLKTWDDELAAFAFDPEEDLL